MADFISELVSAANEERERFRGRPETDKTVKPVLLEYWMKGAGEKEAPAEKEIIKRTAWSAAFISFVVKKALKNSESQAAFEFSSSHSVYAGAAIRNQLSNAPLPSFYGFPPTGAGAVPPLVGDLIGVTRTLRIDDYADAVDAARQSDKDKRRYFSHFDVVVNIAHGQVTTIGGNVGDTVGRKTIKLKNNILPILPFRFDKAGKVISGPFICIVRHMT